MGLTHIKARIANPGRPAKSSTVTFLVDSGAVYSVVPGATLRRLGIRSHSSRTFLLADGSEITRRVGDALFIIDGQRAASPVIFGEKDDSPLLGMVSLESLGLILDPLKRVLRPLPMVLGQLRGVRLVKVGRRLVARPSALRAARSPIDVAALVDKERGR